MIIIFVIIAVIILLRTHNRDVKSERLRAEELYFYNAMTEAKSRPPTVDIVKEKTSVSTHKPKTTDVKTKPNFDDVGILPNIPKDLLDDLEPVSNSSHGYGMRIPFSSNPLSTSLTTGEMISELGSSVGRLALGFL